MSCLYAECALLGMLVLAVGFAVGSAQSPALDPALEALVMYTKRVDALYNQGKLNGEAEIANTKTGAMTLLGLQGTYISQDPKDRDPVAFKKQADEALTTLLAQLDTAVTPIVTDPNAAKTIDGSGAGGSSEMDASDWGDAAAIAASLNKKKGAQSYNERIGLKKPNDSEMGASEAKQTLDNLHRTNYNVPEEYQAKNLGPESASAVASDKTTVIPDRPNSRR